MFNTKSFNINVIRNAVADYEQRHGNVGGLTVVHTHISADDYTAQGHAQSSQDGVIFEVERLANKRLEELQSRQQRQQALRERYESGELTFEQWEAEYIFSF